ncbi:MAG: nuclear transport factor 2 family protein [Alphaproteobacteria bacterium]
MRKFVLLAGAAVILSVSAPAMAQPKPTDVDQVVQRHMAAYDKHDVEGLMVDYGDDVVAVFSGQILQGKPAMRAMFTRYFSSGKAAPFDVKLDRVEGDAGVTAWVMNPGTADARQGNDVFIVRNGKIVFQTTTNAKPVEPQKPAEPPKP